MKISKKIVAALIFILILVTGIFWFSPDRSIREGMLIVTAVPSVVDLENDDLGIDGRYIPEARILAVDPQDPDGEPLFLTEEFYSARSPEVSYDGREMVFTAQKSENDTWQIYVKNLETFEVQQVTRCPVNCTDPVWLPDGRIGFSRLNEEEVPGQVHVLYACYPDGSSMERLTFHPNSDISPSITMDGRIIVSSGRRYPADGPQQMMALRVDGTKAELYYQGSQDRILSSRGWESPDGLVYFVEKNSSGPVSGRLVSVDHGHPLSSRREIQLNERGSVHSVFPLSGGGLCLSFRTEDGQAYGLSFFEVSGRKLRDEIYTLQEYHLIEPVSVEPRKVPMKLPPVVDGTKDKGTLLCHDTDLSMSTPEGIEQEKLKIHRVQVFGMDGILGEVEVEEDGSFYIEIDADKPVRFRTLNADGKVVRGPSAWIWVRPNERRSCIGCHEDRELAPENRVPDALYSGMVSLPDGKKAEAIVLSEKYGAK